MTFQSDSVPRAGEECCSGRIRTIECSAEYGFTKRLTAAVTSVQNVSLAVSRLSETGHQVQFDRAGGCIVNERYGGKIPLLLKNVVCIDKLWVQEENTTRTRIRRLGSWGALWGSNLHLRL